MSHPSLGVLFCTLGVLLLLAAFFAGSETALMRLNRYRLRHRAKAGNRGARLAEALLHRRPVPIDDAAHAVEEYETAVVALAARRG